MTYFVNVFMSFNGSLVSSYHKASKGGMISEWWVGRNLNGSGSGRVWGTSLANACWAWGKARETWVSGQWFEPGTSLNMKQECSRMQRSVWRILVPGVKLLVAAFGIEPWTFWTLGYQHGNRIDPDCPMSLRLINKAPRHDVWGKKCKAIPVTGREGQ
jgi:hypothetical protein